MSEWNFDMTKAPRDSTMVQLLVQQSDGGHSCNPTEDEKYYRTIGFNNFDHDDDPEWKFAGWNWENDYFTRGYGKPVAWQPLAERPKHEQLTKKRAG